MVTSIILNNKSKQIRKLFATLSSLENINLDDYDLNRIIAYEANGINFKGYNVTYNTKEGLSSFVIGNIYHFFEAPKNTNEKDSLYGEFLFIGENISYNYYIFGKMIVNLNKEETLKRRSLVESVYFDPFGKYEIEDNQIKKSESGYDFTPGLKSSEHTYRFDSFNNRKIAYQKSTYDILISLNSIF